MKIAICLYGVNPFDTKKYGNNYPYEQPISDEFRIDNLSYHSLKSWKDNIISNNQIEFFLHCWTENKQHQQKLIEIFNPVSHKFEKIIYKDSVISSSLSVKNSVKLLEEYENLNSFEYDLVLICRMDLVWFRPINLIETFDIEKFTVTHWGIRDIEPNKTWNEPYEGSKFGTHDVIFASNSKNAKIYSNLYDHIEEYRSNEQDLKSHHTIKRYHIEQTGLISIIDHKLFVNKDLEIESRCSPNNPDFLDYLKKIKL